SSAAIRSPPRRVALRRSRSRNPRGQRSPVRPARPAVAVVRHRARDEPNRERNTCMTHSRPVVATVAGLALTCGLARDILAQPGPPPGGAPTAASSPGAGNPSAGGAFVASSAEPVATPDSGSGTAIGATGQPAAAAPESAAMPAEAEAQAPADAEAQ